MAIDLSALEDFDQPIQKKTSASEVAGNVPGGVPMELPLTEIEEDPNQPRIEFDPDALQAMAASIQSSGVLSPISVRPHPARSGGWIINHGARRYRASIAAGKTTIPAFINKTHDDYDQVVENLIRDDLTPMELAQFIRQKLNAGDSKSKVAKRLSKSAKFITLHLALIDPPDSVSSAYTEGKTTSVETLYNLRLLAEKHPEQVAAWVAGQQDISRSAVEALATRLTGISIEAPAKFSHEKISGEGEKHTQGQSTASSTEIDNAETAPDFSAGGDHASAKTARVSTEIKNAVLIVTHAKRSAKVLLNRRPSRHGLLHIRYEDSGEECEVDATHCQIRFLSEA